MLYVDLPQQMIEAGRTRARVSPDFPLTLEQLRYTAARLRLERFLEPGFGGTVPRKHAQTIHEMRETAAIAITMWDNVEGMELLVDSIQLSLVQCLQDSPNEVLATSAIFQEVLNGQAHNCQTEKAEKYNLRIARDARLSHQRHVTRAECPGESGAVRNPSGEGQSPGSRTEEVPKDQTKGGSVVGRWWRTLWTRSGSRHD